MSSQKMVQERAETEDRAVRSPDLPWTYRPGTVSAYLIDADPSEPPVASIPSSGRSNAETDAIAQRIVRAVNSHQQMREALQNALSLLQAFGGDLTKYPKSEANAGHIDAVMWTAQTEIAAALAASDKL